MDWYFCVRLPHAAENDLESALVRAGLPRGRAEKWSRNPRGDKMRFLLGFREKEEKEENPLDEEEDEEEEDRSGKSSGKKSRSQPVAWHQEMSALLKVFPVAGLWCDRD